MKTALSEGLVGHRDFAARRARGFTLIELVSVIVILGAIAAVALPVYRSLKYDARVAAMRQIEAVIAENQKVAMTAYLARGSAGRMSCGGWDSDSVVIDGRAISVWAADDDLAQYYGLPAGAPSSCGMFVMLGCGSHADADAPPYRTVSGGPCGPLAGYKVAAGTPSLIVWLDGTVAEDGSGRYSGCRLEYWPDIGYSYPLPDDNDPVVGVRMSVWSYYAYAGYDGQEAWMTCSR